MLIWNSQCCHTAGDADGAAAGRRTCCALGVSSVQSEDGLILLINPHICSITPPCMHALPQRKIPFFCHHDSKKGDKAFGAELVLAALKKQVLAGLWLAWLCTPTPRWPQEHFWCQVDLPSVPGWVVSHMPLGGCEAVPAAFGRVGGPPGGCFQQVLWMHLNLEVNKRNEYWTDACPVTESE